MHCNWLVFAAVLGSGLLTGDQRSQASPLTEAPSTAVITTVHGVTWVAFHFDLEALQGIDWNRGSTLFLEWDIEGAPSLERSEYALFAAPGAWTDAESLSELALPEEAMATWEIEVRDQGRVGGFVRLDVTSLVSAWMMEEVPNRGVIVVTDDIEADVLAGQLSAARLVVR